MLAGGAIDTISGRQHLAASDMHKMEITAAATVMHRMIPVRGVLQEARVPQELGTMQSGMDTAWPDGDHAAAADTRQASTPNRQGRSAASQ